MKLIYNIKQVLQCSKIDPKKFEFFSAQGYKFVIVNFSKRYISSLAVPSNNLCKYWLWQILEDLLCKIGAKVFLQVGVNQLPTPSEKNV